MNGGGVYLGSGNSLAMLGCAIRGCHPGSYGGIGGGIYAASGSRLTLTNSSIVGSGYPLHSPSCD